ncbi:YggT family protein [Nocardia sp. CDC153]|uniref:YggT family protein n=1 Tax=Nocardia sp. CDC153 TaxID=3112167 RepID=UPI002DBCCEBF|nr:YggT family protein [Nocardia sp. CDC153]MEC3954042.1 YggT family protein [Nocardia sp. CDC153]
MSVIGSLLGLVLTLFLLLLIGRLIVDWIVTLSENPQGVRRPQEILHRLTEPVIAPVRRVLRPVRLGGVQIDLAFTVVFVAVLILRAVAFSL